MKAHRHKVLIESLSVRNYNQVFMIYRETISKFRVCFRIIFFYLIIHFVIIIFIDRFNDSNVSLPHIKFVKPKYVSTLFPIPNAELLIPDIFLTRFVNC